jgi:lantibiotic transport system ATP-binding protein
MLEVDSLTKRFGATVAVDGLSFKAEPGRVLGFLGPNGAGKTTTLRTLLGLTIPTSGSATVDGRPYRELSDPVRVLGAVLEGPQFHPGRTGRNHLRVLASAAGLATRRVDEVLRLVELDGAGGRRVKGYSLGMRQRLSLAGALLGDPRGLVLDEPTNGLDPQGTREVRALIGSLAAEGATVLLSTHLLAEVEQICTHVGVMHRGRLVTQAPLAQLRAEAAARARVETERPEVAARVLRELGLTEVSTTGGTATGLLAAVAPEKVVAALVHDGVPVRGFAVDAPGLEELFVSLTGEGFDVSG